MSRRLAGSSELASSVLVGASYVAFLALVLWGFWGSVAHALPIGANRDDVQLIVWILSWVEHALTTDPASLFEANIGHPARQQLASTEHLLAVQLAFAPLRAVTENPVAATNLAAFLTYVLAALCTERLVRALGAHPVAAWLAGLAAALGPLAVPFNVHVLQFSVFWIPLVALLLRRLRDQPTVGRAAWLCLAFAGGIFTSAYMAAILGVFAALWALYELLRPAPHRLRYLVLGAAAAGIAIAALLLVMQPYLARAASQFHLPTYSLTRAEVRGRLTIAAMMVTQTFGVLPTVTIVLAALVAWWAGSPFARRIVPIALPLAGLSVLLAMGLPQPIAELLAGTPFVLFRNPVRFTIVTGFCVALLLAAALDCALRRTRPSLGVLVAAIAGCFVVATAATSLPAVRLHPVAALARPDRPYDELAELARRHGPGPVLELPLEGFHPELQKGMRLEPDAMIGSTRHWLPLVTGYTGYQPDHRHLLLNLIHQLPDEAALRDLIDLTHLRWIALRPRSEWIKKGRYDRLVEGLLGSPSVGADYALNEWRIFRLDAAPTHPEWLEHVQNGTAPDETLLGTKLAPIAENAAVGSVVAQPLSDGAAARKHFRVRVTAWNDGKAAWPAAVRPEHPAIGHVPPGPLPEKYRVLLVATWSKTDGSADDVKQTSVALRRDVPPGDAIEQTLTVPIPETPGAYELEIGLAQVDGARFTSPANQPARLLVEVAPAPRSSAG
ncbi:MAG TPA: hypothetical protein VIS07_13190 [Candidatus Binatia bacterium]